MLVGPLLFPTNAGCEAKILQEVAAPSPGRGATLREEICSDGAFTTTRLLIAALVSSDTKIDVYAIDIGGSDQMLSLDWPDAQTLRIRSPKNTLVVFSQPEHNGITITVEYTR